MKKGCETGYGERVQNVYGVWLHPYEHPLADFWHAAITHICGCVRVHEGVCACVGFMCVEHATVTGSSERNKAASQ